MFNKKISLTENYNKQRLPAVYSDLFANKIKQPVYLEMTVDHKCSWFSSNYLALQTDKFSLYKIFFDAVCWCKFSFNYRTKTAKVGYMATTMGFKKRGLQQMLQAAICELFDVEKIVFEQTLPDGKRYIKKSKLFLNYSSEIIHEKRTDFYCDVNKDYLKTLF